MFIEHCLLQKLLPYAQRSGVQKGNTTAMHHKPFSARAQEMNEGPPQRVKILVDLY